VESGLEATDRITLRTYNYEVLNIVTRVQIPINVKLIKLILDLFWVIPINVKLIKFSTSQHKTSTSYRTGLEI
jgi:hypothetical protein